MYWKYFKYFGLPGFNSQRSQKTNPLFGSGPKESIDKTAEILNFAARFSHSSPVGDLKCQTASGNPLRRKGNWIGKTFTEIE